jgi:hypothetical protein
VFKKVFEFSTKPPTDVPTDAPTKAPTDAPTDAPTEAPTDVTTQTPTKHPTEVPTDAPTEARPEAPMEVPTETPTEAPTEVRREAQRCGLKDRSCVVEQMCQDLSSREMHWEQNPSALSELLDQRWTSCERWIGRHETGKTMRRQYLELARRWHPDKWASHGDHCIAVANDVTKNLVIAYERAVEELPTQDREVPRHEAKQSPSDMCKMSRILKQMRQPMKQRLDQQRRAYEARVTRERREKAAADELWRERVRQARRGFFRSTRQRV